MTAQAALGDCRSQPAVGFLVWGDCKRKLESPPGSLGHCRSLEYLKEQPATWSQEPYESLSSGARSAERSVVSHRSLSVTAAGLRPPCSSTGCHCWSTPVPLLHPGLARLLVLARCIGAGRLAAPTLEAAITIRWSPVWRPQRPAKWDQHPRDDQHQRGAQDGGFEPTMGWSPKWRPSTVGRSHPAFEPTFTMGCVVTSTVGMEPTVRWSYLWGGSIRRMEPVVGWSQPTADWPAVAPGSPPAQRPDGAPQDAPRSPLRVEGV